MKSLQHILEGILDKNLDIKDEDLDTLDKFLKEFSWRGCIKSSADPARFHNVLKYSGKEIPEASIYDAKESLRAGNAFLIVSNYRRLHEVAFLFLMWPKDGDEFYYVDTSDKVISWAKPKVGDVDWLINLRCGLDYQKDSIPQYLPKNCDYYELPPEQYKKFLTIMGKGKAPV